MAEIPHELRPVVGAPRSQNGKIPYVERADGSLLEDSSLIIETLTREYGVNLDAHLTVSSKALGVLLQRTLEEDLYFHVVYERWAMDDNWRITEPAYFGQLPWLVRKLAIPWVRRKTIASTRGQGVARLSPQMRAAKAEATIQAIAQTLGDKLFLLGELSSFDAIAYAFLVHTLFVPKDYKSAIATAARQHPNLLDYCERMRQKYYPDSMQPLS